MSLECSECECDLRGGHAPDCSRGRFPRLHGRQVLFSDMTWPACGAPVADLVYRLLYSPKDLTRDDQCLLASIVSAYTALVTSTQKTRNKICKAIVEVVNRDWEQDQ